MPPLFFRIGEVALHLSGRQLRLVAMGSEGVLGEMSIALPARSIIRGPRSAAADAGLAAFTETMFAPSLRKMTFSVGRGGGTRRLELCLGRDADLTELRSRWGLDESQPCRAVQHHVPDVPPRVRRWSGRAGQACSGPSRQERPVGKEEFGRPFGTQARRR